MATMSKVERLKAQLAKAEAEEAERAEAGSNIEAARETLATIERRERAAKKTWLEERGLAVAQRQEVRRLEYILGLRSNKRGSKAATTPGAEEASDEPS